MPILSSPTAPTRCAASTGVVRGARRARERVERPGERGGGPGGQVRRQRVVGRWCGFCGLVREGVDGAVGGGEDEDVVRHAEGWTWTAAEVHTRWMQRNATRST